jgi:hypothetical protein
MTLTDTQLLVLSSASQREDGLAALPDHLKGGAAKSVVLKLIAKGLLEEATVGCDDPHWRRLIGHSSALTRTGRRYRTEPSSSAKAAPAGSRR